MNNPQEFTTWDDCIDIQSSFLTGFNTAKDALLGIGMNAVDKPELKKKADHSLHCLALLENQVNVYMADKNQLLVKGKPLTADDFPTAYAIFTYYTVALNELNKTMESFL